MARCLFVLTSLLFFAFVDVSRAVIAEPAKLDVATKFYKIDFLSSGGTASFWRTFDSDQKPLETVDKFHFTGVGLKWKVSETETLKSDESISFTKTVKRSGESIEVRLAGYIPDLGMSLVKSYTFFENTARFLFSIDLTPRQSDVVNNVPSELFLNLGDRVPEAEFSIADQGYRYARPFAINDSALEWNDDQEFTHGMVVGINYRNAVLSVAQVTSDFGNLRFESVTNTALVSIGSLGKQPVGTRKASFNFYLGKKDLGTLSSFSPSQAILIYPGLWSWVRQLCLGTESLLSWVHKLTGSWGLSIILIALAVKLLTFPAVQTGLKNQRRLSAVQRKMAPELKAIEKEYENDWVLKYEKIRLLNKEYGVGAFDGLKGAMPLLVQIPFYILSFQVLTQMPSLGGEPFMWLSDLARPDAILTHGLSLPFFGDQVHLFPILMFAFTVISTYRTRSMATTQKAIFFQKFSTIGIGILFLILLYPAPAGLTLYFASTCLFHWLFQEFFEPEAQELNSMEKEHSHATA